MRAPNIQDLLGTSRATYSPPQHVSFRPKLTADDKENDDIHNANTIKASHQKNMSTRSNIEKLDMKSNDKSSDKEKDKYNDMSFDSSHISNSMHEKKLRVQASDRHDQYMRRLHKLSLMRPLVPREAGDIVRRLHEQESLSTELPPHSLSKMRPDDHLKPSLADMPLLSDQPSEPNREAEELLQLKEKCQSLQKQLELAEQSNKNLQIRLSDMTEMYAMLEVVHIGFVYWF